MKFVAASIVAAVGIYLDAMRDPHPFLPLWVESLAMLVVILPLSLGCRWLTRKIEGPLARVMDLALLFSVTGGYCFFSMMTIAEKTNGFLRPSARLWFHMTENLWLMLFVPFGVTVALWELIARRKARTPQPLSQP